MKAEPGAVADYGYATREKCALYDIMWLVFPLHKMIKEKDDYDMSLLTYDSVIDECLKLTTSM